MRRISLAVCLSLAFAINMTAQWKVQNKTPDKIYVSIAFGQQDGTYVSQGWWEVAPCGGTVVVHGGPLAVTGAFLYARDDGGNVWDGENLFCVADGKPFSLIRQGDCEKRGYKTAGFRLENIKQTPHTTYLTGHSKSGKTCY